MREPLPLPSEAADDTQPTAEIQQLIEQMDSEELERLLVELEPIPENEATV